MLTKIQKNISEKTSVIRRVPVLRFPGFSGEWKEKRLGEICNITTGKLDANAMVENGEYRFYTCAKDFYRIDKYAFDTEALLISGNGANVGYVHYYSGKFNAYQRTYILDAFSQNIFYIRYFLDRFLKRRIDLEKKEGNTPYIVLGTLSEMNISFPIVTEQQKIAEFLSTVDKKIERLSDKKKSLERYKKGVMQKLFSQEIRFRDEHGNPYPDWEERKLGEIARIYDGTHQTPSYKKSGVPFYSVEHVTSNNFSKTKFISQEIFEKENTRVRLEKGDILMTRIGDIGTSKYISWEARASFYVSLTLIKGSELINCVFLDQLIKSRNFQRELWKRTIHVAFPKKINLGEIGDCNILIPSLSEQQKIADFLMGLDEKISVVGDELSRAKEFKRGLLQQMFV